MIIVTNDGMAQIPIGSDLSPFDYSRPKEYEIAGVKVSGIKYLDENVIVMLSGLAVGDKIKVPGDKTTDAVRKLWDQGLFEDVAITADNIVGGLIFLNIELKERPRVSKFSFDGLSKSEADEIRNKIKRAVTDSGSEVIISDDKPGVKNLAMLYQVATGKSFEAIEAEFAGKGYGDFKSAVADAVAEFINPIRTRYEEISKDKQYLESVLKKGAENARRRAFSTLRKVYKKLGFVQF